jgi:predicted nucleotidyltransferase
VHPFVVVQFGRGGPICTCAVPGRSEHNGRVDDVSGWLDRLPTELAAQRRLLVRLLAWCERDDDVRWLTVGCSLVRGNADWMSDLDVAIGVREEHLEHALGQAHQALADIGDLVESYDYLLPLSFPLRRVFAQYRDRTQVDLTVGSAPFVNRAVGVKPALPCNVIGLLVVRVGRTPVLKDPDLTNVDGIYSKHLFELSRLWFQRPVEGEVGYVLPAGLAAGVVIAAWKHLVRSDRCRVFGVLLVVVLLNGWRQDVVAATGDEQQRRPVIIGKVEGRGRMWREIRKTALEQDLGRRRGRISVVGGLSSVLVQCVGKG